MAFITFLRARKRTVIALGLSAEELMAETPKLTTRELAALIKAEEDLTKRLRLIEEFCKAYDAEHVLRHEKNKSDRHSESAPLD